MDLRLSIFTEGSIPEQKLPLMESLMVGENERTHRNSFINFREQSVFLEKASKPSTSLLQAHIWSVDPGN